MATPGFCRRCGSKLDPGSYFCNSCGVSLNAPSPYSAQTQPLLGETQQVLLFAQDEYVIDKKILAIRDTFAVKNRSGELLGYIKKKMTSTGPQFFFEDLNGQHLGEVHGKILTIHHIYEIFGSGGNRVGLVNKRIMKPLGTEWWLEAPVGTEVATVQGSIPNHDYLMLNPVRRPIVQVHRKWVSVRDSYCIEILDQRVDRLLILGFAVAMDSVKSEEHQ